MAQIYPGTSQVAQNRRNFCNPDYELEKLREISDEDVVKILGHRAPGEEYKSVHPPLDEMDEPDSFVDGAVSGSAAGAVQPRGNCGAVGVPNGDAAGDKTGDRQTKAAGGTD